MFKLRRITLANVGWKDAFFEGENLWFTDPEEDAPVDTVLNAANGNGKTSALALLFSCFDTETTRFMRTLANKHERFEDYFQTSEPALVASEWTDGRNRTVIGQMVVPKAGMLDRYFFAFRGDRDFGIRHLPFPDLGCAREERMRTREQALRWLRETTAERQDSHDFWRTDRQGEWKQRLPSYGIDPQLLAWMVDLNKEEGGITNFLRFNSERGFLARFLEMAVLQQMAADARASMQAAVRELAGSVKSREGLAAAEALHAKASAFAGSAARLQGAREASRRSRARHAGLRSALLAEKARLGERKLEAATERDAARQQIAEAEERKGVAGDSLAAAETAMAEADAVAAEKRLRTARAELDEAKLRRSVLDAAESRVEMLRLETELAALRKQLEAASRGLEEPERNARRAGDAYAASVEAAFARAEEAKAAADAEASGADQEVKAARRRRETAQAAVERLQKEIGRLSGDIQRVDNERSRLVRDGTLAVAESAAGARVRLEREVETAGAEADQAKRQAEAQAQQARQHTEAAGALRETAAEARSRRDSAQTRLNEAAKARDDLAALEVIASILDGGGFDPESPAILRAIRSEEERCCKAQRENQARINTMEADRASIERHGLAAIDRDAEAVVDHLRANGIGDAMPFAVWLARQNVPADEIRAISERDPAGVSGVWVPNTVTLDRARGLVGRDIGLERPVMVLAGSHDAAALSGERIVFPVARSEAYDPDAARRRLETVHTTMARLSAEANAWGERAELCVGARRRVVEWIEKWGNGALDTLRGALARAVDELRDAEAGTAEHKASAEACWRVYDAERSRADQANERRRKAETRLAAVDHFIVGFEEKLPALTENLSVAQRSLENNQEARGEAERSLEEWQRRFSAALQRSGDANREAGKILSRLHTITYRDGDGQHHTGLSLDEARVAYEQAARALEDLRNGEAASLARQMERKREEIARRAAEFEQRHGAIYRTRAPEIDEAARSDDLGERRTRAGVEADRLSEVVGEVGHAADNARERASALATRLSEGAHAQFDMLVEAGREELTELSRTAEADRARAERERHEAEMLHAKADALYQEAERRHDRMAALADPMSRQEVLSEPVELEADLDRLTDQVGEANTDLVRTTQAEGEVQKGAEKAYRAMRDLATSQRVADANPVLSQNMESWSFEAALADSGKILHGLEQVIAGYRHQIETYRDKQELTVVILFNLAQHAIATLRRACQHGVVPLSVPRMGGRAVLKPGMDLGKIPVEVRREVIRRWLETQIQADRVPERGHDIAADILQELIRNQGKETLGLRILKPTDAGELDWVPVAEMKASGGETLTAALLLWVVLTRLRAESELNNRIAHGGALILDNPIGKANHQLFLRTQRALAAAMGVQLIFTTGSEDLQALGEFPHVLKFGKVGVKNGRVLVKVAAERLGEPRDGYAAPDQADMFAETVA